MTNREIAAVFDQVADLLEFQNANPFRVRAYRNGARKLKDLTEPLATQVADGADLTEIEGIGKDLAEKIETLVGSGKLPMLEELEKEVPASVLPMLRIPGLGPKKAAALYNQLGVVSLDMLRAACQEGKVRELKGFGEKTEQTILAGIDLAARATDRIYWAAADEIVQLLMDHLGGCTAIKQLQPAGSYRRGKETVGDIDILVDADDAGAAMDCFGQFAGIAEVIARGDTKMSVRLDTQLQVDMRVVPAESFGAALQYFTGSKDHNVVVRGLAKKQGLRVNEWGVFRVDENDEQAERVAGETEQEVYAELGLPLFPPELREARQEFTQAEQGELPELVALADIRGDLHMHTNASDGKASLREMIAGAAQRGLEYIAITDHSKRVSMANGLDAERLRAQWREIDQLKDEFDAVTVLKGVECDILESAVMDLPDDVLEQADWVIASLHYGQKQPREKIMQRLLMAVEHPQVNIIAHPTGRLINRREAYDVNVDELVDAARQHGKFLELNANPARLDLDDNHCALAKRRGVPIVISSDAHAVGGLDVLRYGVLQARRAGLQAADVVNTLPLALFQKRLVGSGND